MPRFLVLLCVLFSLDAVACDGLALDHVWLREPPPGSEVAAAYFDARNDTAREIIIQGVASPAFKNAMVHRTLMIDGRAEMRPQGNIVLAPGAHFSAQPGGAHVMLFGARRSLQDGASLTLELHCTAGPPLRVALPALRAAPP